MLSILKQQSNFSNAVDSQEQHHLFSWHKKQITNIFVDEFKKKYIVCTYISLYDKWLKGIFLPMSAASNDELWIGLNDKKAEGLFDWSDHSTVRFTSWEFGKPGLISVQEDCVLIRGEVRSNICYQY